MNFKRNSVEAIKWEDAQLKCVIANL